MADTISRGALRRICNGEVVENPVFQCVSLKFMAGANANNDVERYRVVWNDVDNFIQSMLTTQLNSLVHSNSLQKGCFVRLKQFQAQTVKGKKVLIVLDCEVLEDLGIQEKVGQPVALDGEVKAEDDSTKQEPPQQQQQQQQPSAISSNGFYGNANKPQQNQQNQPPRSLPTRTNNPASSSYGNIYPIEALSPYQHKWTVKVRCTHKSDIKTWHNKNGEGKLFSANFLDDSGEIRGTGFNEQCDALYDIFQEGGVYYISTPCRVQLAKKQFSNLNNDYELAFEKGTVVEKAESTEQDNVPKIRYNFTGIGELDKVEKDAIIDTIGVVKEVGEVSQITGKTSSKPYDKRELTIVDNSSYSIRLTIWGNSAITFDAPTEAVIAFKGLKVSDFGGRSLSLLSSGSMTVNPDIDEAHKLKGWYDANGALSNFQSHAATMGTTGANGPSQEYKTIAAIKEENLGMSDVAAYFTLKATVVYIKQESFAYPACSSEGCNKKVIETDPGQWRCERCDRTWPNPEYRYILSANVSDHTGQLWLSCFDDVGRLLTGCPANELVQLKDENNSAFLEKINDANCRTWVFRCRAKMDTFQEQQRVRYQVMSAHALNFTAEMARMTEQIKQYNIDEGSLFIK